MQVKIYRNDKCHVFNNILESLIMILDNLFMLNEIFQSVHSLLATTFVVGPISSGPDLDPNRLISDIINSRPKVNQY